MTGPTTIEVRALGADDWQSWRDLRLRCLQDSPEAFGSTYDTERRFTERTWRERLADPASTRLLAARDGEPVGIGGATPDGPGRARVVSMWVAPTARGERIAHHLLQHAENWAALHGLRLHLDVTTANTAARHCYERYGFRRTGEVRPLRPGRDVLVERLVLERQDGLSGRRGCR